MSPRIDPTRIANKQITRATSAEAAQFYKEAMEALDVNPAALAAAKDKKALAALQEVFGSGTWAKIMRAIPKEAITGPAIAFGGANLTAGVSNRQAKITAFWAKWAPKLDGIVAAVNAMPDTTVAEKEAKMLANKRKLAEAKGTWR